MHFTVVIPLFNKGPYIGCTLASVLAQRFTDFEVIVVDDGSSDDGPAVVQAIADQDARVQLVRQGNAGVAAARNHGIALARGEWVSFLDADDWQHPAFLSTLVLAQAAYPEADTVATDFVRIPHSDSPDWPPRWHVPQAAPEIELITNLARRWMRGPTLCSSAIAVKRSRLLPMQPCFATGESVGEDLDLWFRLAEKAPIALAHLPLAAYRVAVQGSLTSFHSQLESAPFLQRLRRRALSGMLSPAQRRDSLWLVAQHEVSLARELLLAGHRGDALRWLLRAYPAMTDRRWWMTALMLLMPRAQAQQWQAWRALRSQALQPPPMPDESASADAAAIADSCTVSIIVKALNEEKNIVVTLQSALRALAPVGGEVVLADSCSTDQTVALARSLLVRVVQLQHARERCCGVGPQLGFQHARGDYVYLLDGDMQMQPGFLERALSFLQRHPEIAGVGGRLVERNHDSLEYRARTERAPQHLAPGEVDRLDGGGLYRRSAIASVGYLSNRNLHSYEELDLALRLRARGWILWRLPDVSVSHRGHDSPPYQLLKRRWRSGYVWGLGELLRDALAQGRAKALWQTLPELRLYVAVLAWWALLTLVLAWPGAAHWTARLAWVAALALAPVLLMAWRKRSLRRGVYAVVSWCFHAAGLVRGVLRQQQNPLAPIASQVLQAGSTLVVTPPERADPVPVHEHDRPDAAAPATPSMPAPLAANLATVQAYRARKPPRRSAYP